MRYYSLQYRTAERCAASRKKFKSRTAAINYAFNHFPSNAQLEYENELSKHVIEYICNNNIRFIVSRCFA